ncbi:MAG: glutamine--fructose-6-phosphate transaminase (isomerizing) [Thermotogota bacterium]
MCGIVGFVGKDIKIEDLVTGLKKLEYRGYDSAGIAYNNDNSIEISKKEGKIEILKEHLNDSLNKKIKSGIAHTRWATHGSVSDKNSHPHSGEKNEIVIVHNGIIENYQELKDDLIEDGVKFISDTDTEVIAQVLEREYNGDLFETVRKAVRKFEGAYAIGVMHKDDPNTIIAARKGSPMVIANNGHTSILASDVTPILKYSKKVVFLDDGEIVKLKPEKYDIYDLDNNKINKEEIEIKWDETLAEKGGYDHFMEKEINEQPQAIKSALAGRIENGYPTIKELESIKDFIKNKLEKIYIVACGTSFHAGYSMKYLIEAYSNINISLEVASEFRYMNPHVDEKTLVIAVSQSGETIDTLEGIRLAKQKGAHVLAMSNVVGSTIPRESHSVVYMNTGPEIGVAATKTYTAQIAILYAIAAQIMLWKDYYTNEVKEIIKELELIPDIYKEILANKDHILELAREYTHYKHMMFIGRGFGYTASLEGALKLKEISYINANGYQAGELKHGPIALLDESFPVFAIVPFNGLREKMVSNIMEVKARKARVIAISTKGDKKISKITNEYIEVPKTSESISPLTVAPVTQLFAYYVAILRNLDPDKPRNLAKSVTVE